MKGRIKILLEHFRVSPSQFADKIGAQRSAVSHILSGRNNPSLELLQKILTNYPQVNPDWLLMSKGNIEREELRRPLKRTAEADPALDTVEESRISGSKREDQSGVISDGESVEVKMPESADNKPLKTQDQEARMDNPDRVILIYSDGTFEEFIPRKK